MVGKDGFFRMHLASYSTRNIAVATGTMMAEKRTQFFALWLHSSLVLNIAKALTQDAQTCRTTSQYVSPRL